MFLLSTKFCKKYSRGLLHSKQGVVKKHHSITSKCFDLVNGITSIEGEGVFLKCWKGSLQIPSSRINSLSYGFLWNWIPLISRIFILLIHILFWVASHVVFSSYLSLYNILYMGNIYVYKFLGSFFLLHLFHLIKLIWGCYSIITLSIAPLSYLGN